MQDLDFDPHHEDQMDEAREVLAEQEAERRGYEEEEEDNEGAMFSESPEGYRARDQWARRYDDLNGAPESDYDR